MNKILIIVSIVSCLSFSGCESTGSADEKQKIEALNNLLDVAQAEISKGNSADYGSSASAGIWGSIGTILSSGAIQRVVDLYSGGKLPETAAAAGETFSKIKGEDAQKASEIASVISTASGAPPGI